MIRYIIHILFTINGKEREVVVSVSSFEIFMMILLFLWLILI